MIRIVRAAAGVALLASGALLYAGSWQRWRSTCPFGAYESDACLRAQDSRYDFWPPPSDPWIPVGNAAELAGLSMLLLALAVLLLPWALTGRRPGLVSGPLTLAAAASVGLTGVLDLTAGRRGEPAAHALEGLAGFGWAVLLPFMISVCVIVASRWSERAAGISLVLALPLPGMFLYWMGPYDTAPWFEGIAGGLTATAGLLLVVPAALESAHGHRARRSGHHPEQAGAAGGLAADAPLVAGR